VRRKSLLIVLAALFLVLVVVGIVFGNLGDIAFNGSTL